MQVKDSSNPDGPPPILVEDLTLSFGNSPLFRDLSMEIGGGQCTCILGPSGCGKSTLLRLISGANGLNYSGRIKTPSENTLSQSTAWMSQNDLLLPWMSVEQNVLLGARLRFQVSSSLQEKGAQLLQDAGLAMYAKSLPSALSGGMRQRVALLRTLMEDRPVLLMDEPFSALDALTRIKLQQVSAKLTRGKTVLLVTHDPLEALRLGDKILVLAGSPVKVVACFEPGGESPRDAADNTVSKQYPLLLKTLMEH